MKTTLKKFVSWPNIFEYKTVIKPEKSMNSINDMSYDDIIDTAHNSGNYIYEARKSGWKVKIYHFRYLQPIKESFLNLPLKFILDFNLSYLQDEKNYFDSKEDVDNGFYRVFPRGGRTIVYLSKDGKEYKGESECSINDNFDRKVGNYIAYRRALEQIS